MKKQADHISTTTTVVADGLTAEEERILRMRSGASLPGTAALGNKLDAVTGPGREEAVARLRLIEAALLAEHAERQEADPEDPALHQGRKARIIAALRDKPEE
ncbi:MAG: hypothetical protein H6701_01260 [Myxococcales bacterium]|nr:hypothetical protein [Myxococcales bacterium]